MQNLEARLGEIDQMIVALGNQRVELLETRQKLQASWAQGACQSNADLALKPHRKAA